MNWKEQLRKHENRNDWESGIKLLQQIIDKYPDNLDAYLSMIYLLTDLLVEGNYPEGKRDYYTGLLKKYYLESYSKFSNKPEYLFYLGKIVCMSEWYFDLEIEEAESMMKKAARLEPEKTLYEWAKYSELDMRDPDNKKRMKLYANKALLNSAVKKELKEKGSLGKYLLELLKYWKDLEIS